MKYWWNGLLCSLKVNYISSECVKYTEWIGGLCYAIFMITCWFISMVTYPGYSNISKLTKWYHNTYGPIGFWSNIIWAVFNILSTLVTIVGIYKIIHTLHQLKKYNPYLKTNYFQLTLHALVLILNLFPVFLFSLPAEWFTFR
jgi:hypothetical protein